MKILHRRPVASGSTMRGVVDIELDIGLQIYEVVVHGNNGPWVALPARVVIGKDGAVRRKLVNGKPDYQRILKWRDRDTADKFRPPSSSFCCAITRTLLVKARHERQSDRSSLGQSPTRRSSKKPVRSRNAYGNEKYFAVEIVTLAGSHDLCRALDRLSREPYAFIIRGEPRLSPTAGIRGVC